MDIKIKLIDPPQVVMSNPNSTRNYFAWPTIANLQNGEICVGASGYRLEHICPFGKGVISFSKDNGKTYSEPVAVIDTVLDDRDVGLTPFGKSGLIVTSFNNTLDFQRKNMPQTPECFDYINSVSKQAESDALGVSFRISKDYGKTFGPVFKSPVSSPHGPTLLNDGTVLWVGRIQSEHNIIEAHTINTENGKMTLRGELKLNKYDDLKDLTFYEPHAIQLKSGKIICHLRTHNNGDMFTLYQTESPDNGISWAKPRPILTEKSGAPGHLLEHSSGVLITTFSHRSKPYGIWTAFSKDGGITWGDEAVIFEGKDTDDLGYPSTIELPDGSLITAFYTRESDCTPAVIMQQKWNIEYK